MNDGDPIQNLVYMCEQVTLVDIQEARDLEWDDFFGREHIDREEVDQLVFNQSFWGLLEILQYDCVH